MQVSLNRGLKNFIYLNRSLSPAFKTFINQIING